MQTNVCGEHCVESPLKEAEDPQTFFSPKTKSCFVTFENIRKAFFPLKQNHASLLLRKLESTWNQEYLYQFHTLTTVTEQRNLRRTNRLILRMRNLVARKGKWWTWSHRVIYIINIELQGLALPWATFFSLTETKINHIKDVAMYMAMSKRQQNQAEMWMLGCQPDSLPSKAIHPHSCQPHSTRNSDACLYDRKLLRDPWELLVRGANLKCQFCKCPSSFIHMRLGHTRAWEEASTSPQLPYPPLNIPSLTAVLPSLPFLSLRLFMFIKLQVVCIYRFLCLERSSTGLLHDWILSFWGCSNALSSVRPFPTPVTTSSPAKRLPPTMGLCDINSCISSVMLITVS